MGLGHWGRERLGEAERERLLLPLRRGPFGAWPRSWRPRCGGGWPVEAKRRVLLREGAIGLEAVARLEAWVRLGDLAL
ncbi:hypothetical protein [Thermus thalpophilus]|uniref:hypothetical protein n=1 Tax=Thermus thalpophilus TaxID=2908147 RepID=UPI001FA9BC22|nr:hypothetical protein [Thermus thalpophilus]